MQTNALQFPNPGTASPVEGASLEGRGDASSGSAGLSFKDRMTSYLNEVNGLQNTADTAANNLALGDVRSLHAVMIAGEEASLALSTAIQVRNKVMESYQEIMRMQV